MDHKEFTRTLSPETLLALNRKADAPGLIHLAGHVALIFGFGLWIVMGWPFWQVALIGQGIVICFLFTLEHEATHQTPFETLRLNEWVGRVCGLLILLPFEWFRYFHLAHHRYTNIPDKDPELLAGHKPESRGAYLCHVSGFPYWWGMAKQLLTNAFGGALDTYISARIEPRIRREARAQLFVYVLVALSLFWSPVLFWVWLLPCLLGQPFLRLYLLAEHGRCAFVANMFENTRTTYTNQVIRFLAWNMPFHTEHHTLPTVPFHRLEDLHDLMQGHHQVTANGYVEFTTEFAGALEK